MLERISRRLLTGLELDFGAQEEQLSITHARHLRRKAGHQARVGDHDPRHDDSFLLAMLQDAQRHFENTQLAQEGWTIRL